MLTRPRQFFLVLVFDSSRRNSVHTVKICACHVQCQINTVTICTCQVCSIEILVHHSVATSAMIPCQQCNIMLHCMHMCLAICMYDMYVLAFGGGASGGRVRKTTISCLTFQMLSRARYSYTHIPYLQFLLHFSGSTPGNLEARSYMASIRCSFYVKLLLCMLAMGC